MKELSISPTISPNKENLIISIVPIFRHVCTIGLLVGSANYLHNDILIDITSHIELYEGVVTLS